MEEEGSEGEKVRDETEKVCVCVCAVSYTHLDVYKRQVVARWFWTIC